MASSARAAFNTNGSDQRAVDLNFRPSIRGVDAVSIAGRTQIDAGTIPTSGTWLYVPCGQSNGNNSINGTATLAHAANIFNINQKGATFLAVEPLLCSDLTDGHHAVSLCDALITDGVATNFVIANGSFGGSYFADFAIGGGTVGGLFAGTSPGDLAYRFGLVNRSIHVAGLDRLPRFLTLLQGEWDSDNVCTTQANATAAISGIIANMKISGLLRPGDCLFIPQQTRITNTDANRNPIRAAQLAAPDGVLVRALADVDTLGTGLRYDGTHFNNTTGRAALVALIKPPIKSFIQSG